MTDCCCLIVHLVLCFVPPFPPLAILLVDGCSCLFLVDLVLVLLSMGIPLFLSVLTSIAQWQVTVGAGFGLLYFIAVCIAVWAIWTHYHSGEAARYLSEGHLTPPGRRPRRNRAAVTAYSELEKGGRWHTGGVDDGDDSATDDEVELRKEVMDRRRRKLSSAQ
ncbi:hypothetical protein DMC30DRAFT_412991 [Rhodotorula diobovata]|uniref:Uncharacterized protein n=1 Tax=Rhodotorula diobovata TaxID=5288 RepID=A0A5C5G6I0_9BASI|nr:hypothetical protein DMC30DRAFT_412991 [Rhodotorula diobovata]